MAIQKRVLGNKMGKEKSSTEVELLLDEQREERKGCQKIGIFFERKEKRKNTI